MKIVFLRFLRFLRLDQFFLSSLSLRRDSLVDPVVLLLQVTVFSQFLWFLRSEIRLCHFDLLDHFGSL